VAPPILAAALLSWHQYGNALVAWMVGGALCLVGWALRIWAQEHVGYRLRVRKVLTSCGPYAYVRNPIYLGNILMGLGAVVASEVLWMLPITLLWYVGVYTLVVREEERRLTIHYGKAYVAYLGAVYRWLPRPAGRPRQPCAHQALGPALLAELHAPLILAPAVLKALHLLRGLGLI
jgi:protein-S-isoprenylcysteine O-methyltransferase Ste14